MVDDVNASKEAVNRIMSYGVSVNVTDNLGNTAIHRIAGVSSAISFCDVLETFIKKVLDINSRNIYGESAGSVLFLEDVFFQFVPDNYYKQQNVEVLIHICLLYSHLISLPLLML
jgi:hypothetical protein